MTQHPYDDIYAFALGDLDADRSAVVLAHADACPVCSAVLAEAMAGVDAISRADGERSSPAVLRMPLAARPMRESLVRWRWIAGIAAAAAVAFGVWSIASRVVAPVVPIAALVHSHFQHHPLTGTGGSAKVVVALDGSWVYLVGDGMSPLRRYELWERRAGEPVRVGSFWTDASGQASYFSRLEPAKVDAYWVERAGQRILAWP